ncbi:MAG: ribonuclease Z [Nanoarchaeota archaeon]|nr:ribonuclease Z [Nanoarchaeota archaeon]
MEKAKITFLGTSNAIPTKKRSHTAILLSYKNENILVDCGEGVQRQFKFANLSPNKLTKIFITHWHGDHVLGLPGLLQTLAMNEFNTVLKLYGPKGTYRNISLLKELFKIKIDLQIKEVTGKFLETPDFFLEARPMMHRIPTLAYSFTIKDKIRLDKKKIEKLKLPHSPLLKKLQEGKDITFKGKKIKSSEVSYIEKGRKITFILDTAPNENTEKIAENSDLLVCESSFSKEEEKIARERLHLTSEDAARIGKKAKAKKLILTHISQRYEHDTKPILNQAKKIFKNTSLAKDFDVVEF